MKPKILFYGNCHAGVLGNFVDLNYSEYFDVVDCTDCGLCGYGHSTKNFVIWSPENSRKSNTFKECVHKKIEECDIFAFMPLGSGGLKEYTTDYLLSQFRKNKLNICLPNSRFQAYPICETSLNYFVNYVYNNISKDHKEILNYLTHENDPAFEELILTGYKTSMDENISRHSIHYSLYENVLGMNDFIEEKWKTNLLFATHSHPIGLYWNELLNRFLDILAFKNKKEDIQIPNYQNKTDYCNVLKLSFFRKFFNDIKIPKESTKLTDIDENTIKNILQNYGH